MTFHCSVKNRNLLKALCILFCIYLLGIYAIIRANFNYIDDMGRALLGYKDFNFFGRYIPQFFTTVLHADNYLTDVSPLPQLFAVAFLAMAAVTVLHAVTGRSEFTIVEYSATIALCLSPYFLECLSYKYDAPYMALSILASVAPVLFYQRGQRWYYVSVVIGMLVVCMSYQAASGIFPMFVVLLAFLKWLENTDWKRILGFVLVSAAGYITGMLLFMLLIYRPEDTYVSNSLPAMAELLPTAFRNLKRYYRYVVDDFKPEWLLMIAVLCAGFVLVSVRDSKRSKFLTLFVSVIVLGVFFVLAFGVYPVLSKPLYDPRAMYGFGALICFVSMPIVTKKRLHLFKAVCVVLCWCFFVFSFTYGNALYAQKRYTDYRITAVIQDLDDLNMFAGDYKLYQINGDVGFSPELDHMPQDHQLLKRLVPDAFGDSSSYWRRFGFSNYYDLKNIYWDDDIDLAEYDLPLVKDSVYHTIYADENNVFIVLKE